MVFVVLAGTEAELGVVTDVDDIDDVEDGDGDGRDTGIVDTAGRDVVVFATITPCAFVRATDLHTASTCASESSSGETLTITAGRFRPGVLETARSAVLITPVKILVSGCSSCKLRSPGVFGLDTFRTRTSAYGASFSAHVS